MTMIWVLAFRQQRVYSFYVQISKTTISYFNTSNYNFNGDKEEQPYP